MGYSSQNCKELDMTEQLSLQHEEVYQFKWDLRIQKGTVVDLGYGTRNTAFWAT